MATTTRKLKRHYEIVGTEPFMVGDRDREFACAGAAYAARDLWWQLSRRYRVVTMTVPAMLVIAALCIFIGVFLPALIFQLLWNYVAVALGAPAISYWLAFCGLWLVAIIRRTLFGD